MPREKFLETTRRIGGVVKNFYQQALETKEKGGRIAWCGIRVPVELLYAMDVYPLFPEHYAAYCAAKRVAVPLCREAENRGYSTDLCSYARCTLGHIFTRDTNEVQAPVMAEPDMFIETTSTCDTRVKWFEEMAELTGRPIKVIELPYTSDLFHLDGSWNLDEALVTLYAREIEEELVPFLEEVTGKRLDLDRLRECLELSGQAHTLLNRVYALRQRYPCPMGSGDAFSDIFHFIYMSGTAAAVDFYHDLLREVQQKVDRGEGVVENERFRLLWSNIPFWFDLGLFSYFSQSWYYLGLTGHQWVDPKHLLDRGAQLDVLARTKEGVLINIEVQVANQYNIVP